MDDGTALRLSLIPCEGEVRRVMAILRQTLERWGMDQMTAGTVEIVLAEVLNNIVEHAYAEAPGQITLEMSLRPDKVECSICDTGAQMPGLALPEGKLASRDPDNLPEGGFGWFLIRSLTEDLRYARQNDANHLYFCLPETT